MIIVRKPREEQYRLNVGGILAMYANGMSDCPEDYKPMTLDETIDYVNSQVYDMLDDGFGTTLYGDGIAKDLKFLPRVRKIAIIKEEAEDCGVLLLGR